MKKISTQHVSRRQFVRGIALTSVSAAVASYLPSSFAAEQMKKMLENSNPDVPILQGKQFEIVITEEMVNITGTPTKATLYNKSIAGPTLVWQEGDTVTIKVTNKLSVSSSLHWHGIILPFTMDGVPGFSYEGIAPGESYTYQFKVQQHGTYWYHSHSAYQEQTGLYGAIVILPKEKEALEYDKDFVVQLSDWSDVDPETVYSNLKKSPDYYNYVRRTVGDFSNEVSEKGLAKAWNGRKMWNKMRMSNRDLSDVSGATYTFLMNGLAPNAHWRALVNKGEKVRLRFINSSAMTFFDIRIPGLKMTVVAADGNLVQPIDVDEFRIGVAETYDVIVEADTDKQPYAIFAQAIDRSGFALGSLTNNTAILASAPALDSVPNLTMVDMGMDMKGMDMKGMDMKGMDMEGMDMKSMDMKGMDMKSMDMKSMDMKGMDMKGMDMGGMDMKGMDMGGMNMGNQDGFAPIDYNPQLPQMEVPRKRGYQTTMRASNPQYRLADPGAGLRNNGRKVLTYADLKNIYSTKSLPKPKRELVLHLTGNMERYMWSIDGIPFDEAPPLRFIYGERVRITFINDTMMNHPMHLHGLWSELETGDENHLPKKHTVVVQPGSKISFRVTMDAMGDWPFHCHMLYHMMGMFRRVQVRMA